MKFSAVYTALSVGAVASAIPTNLTSSSAPAVPDVTIPSNITSVLSLQDNTPNTALCVIGRSSEPSFRFIFPGAVDNFCIWATGPWIQAQVSTNKHGALENKNPYGKAFRKKMRAVGFEVENWEFTYGDLETQDWDNNRFDSGDAFVFFNTYWWGVSPRPYQRVENAIRAISKDRGGVVNGGQGVDCHFVDIGENQSMQARKLYAIAMANGW